MTLSLEAERKKAEETLTLLAAADAAKTAARRQPHHRAQRGGEARGRARAGQHPALRAEAGLRRGPAAGRAPEPADRAAARTAELAAGPARHLRGEGRGGAGADRHPRLQPERGAGAGGDRSRSGARISRSREKERLAAEAQNLESYRSEFFGKMRAILGEREGVQVVGDRFVFPSEVLFAPGSATLGAAGPGAGGAGGAGDPRDRRPDPAGDQLDPAGRRPYRQDPGQRRQPVPATTGSSPRRGRCRWCATWSEVQGLPPDRLAATGFGEYQPIDPGDSPEALAKNRRIELKFTER